VFDDPSGAREFLSSELDTYTVSVGGDYYLFDANLSPFINAGIGWSWVDTNIPSGLPGSVCWWDPWLGYICSSNTPTHDESSFFYSAGAGLRVDFSRRNFLKVGYYRGWADYEKASGSPDNSSVRLELGFSF